MEPHKESSVRYDDRRKEYTQVLIQENEVKIKNKKVGNISIRRTIIYDEEGIRTVLKDLEEQKKACENNIKNLRGLQEHPAMNPELQKLKDKLVTLQKINHAETVSEENRKKEKESLEQSEEDLKTIKKGIREIRETIGSRLKL